ncbi:MAG: hypothetical protein OJF50_005675 [Nitrospira sp.]|nr:hypothetical protein [Nitrospira sp.]
MEATRPRGQLLKDDFKYEVGKEVGRMVRPLARLAPAAIRHGGP